MAETSDLRLAHASSLAAAFLLLPLSARASDFWKPFLAGAASGFVVHESSHLAFDIALDAQPRLKGVHFGPIPFFAVTHRNGLPERREAVISGAGLFSQHVWSEIDLSRQSSAERIAPFSKGVLAFHIATSVAYAGAAFARYGPYERDTRGIADSIGSDERLIGALVLTPAVFDTWRYLRPHSRAAKWGSRLAKIAFVGVIAFKD